MNTFEYSSQVTGFQTGKIDHLHKLLHSLVQVLTIKMEWQNAPLDHCYGDWLNWQKRNNLGLWPFAVEHSLWLWSNIPRYGGEFAQIELFTGGIMECRTLSRTHVWGCTVHFFEPKLQDCNKILKCEPRS